jgi:hypothetical protein
MQDGAVVLAWFAAAQQPGEFSGDLADRRARVRVEQHVSLRPGCW